MKKLIVISTTVLALLALAVTPVLAAPPTVITVGPWCEDGHRYNPDGTDYDVPWNPWTDDPHIAMDLRQTGKAYHVVDIRQFYNLFAPEDIEGHMVISGKGNLSGQAEYVSGVSGLPIRDRFEGSVTIDPDAGTWEGSYTQFSYAYGTEEEVHNYYPEAVRGRPGGPPSSGAAGWWFLFWTEYTAHSCP